MSAAAKQIALVTGANSGIGFEFVRQLLQKGTYHVLLGARSPTKGNAAVSDLQSHSLPGTLSFLQLDLQSDADIETAAATIKNTHGKLDLLVNNAGVALPPGATARERINTAFDINATGTYLLTKALEPSLLSSEAPRIINISSGVGSITQRTDKSSPMYKVSEVQYRATKTAMNMMGANMLAELEGQGVKVFTVCPGFTVSNLSSNNTSENGARSVEECVKSLMGVVEGKRDDEMGKFLHRDGVYGW